MTIEEKFKKGKVLYKNDEGNYVLELWGGSTKHPDSVFHMEDWDMASWVDPTDPEQVKGQIPQWLMYCASHLTFPFHARSLALFAIDYYDNLSKNA